MSGLGGVFGQVFTGNAGDVIGQEGLGLTGTKNNQTQQILLDPTTQALNTLRLNNMMNMGGAVGGFENLIPQYMQSTQMSPDTTALINLSGQYAAQPGLQAGDWYNQAINAINPSAESARLQSLQEQGIGQERTVLDRNLMGLQALQPQLLGAGNDYFRQILQPTLQSQSSLMGLGRSGANQEAQAKGAASISLPIAQLMAQLTQQAYGQYGQGVQSLLGQGYAGQQQLGQQNLQNIQSINQAYPGVSTELQNAQLQRVLQGINSTDVQRQATTGGLQNILQGFISGMNATPYSPAPTQKTSGTGNTGIVSSIL